MLSPDEEILLSTKIEDLTLIESRGYIDSLYFFVIAPKKSLYQSRLCKFLHSSIYNTQKNVQPKLKADADTLNYKQGRMKMCKKIY